MGPLVVARAAIARAAIARAAIARAAIALIGDEAVMNTLRN